MSYFIYQEEMGASGNHHLQGYIEMPRPVRISHFRPLLEKARFDVRKGTAQQASDYCDGMDYKLKIDPDDKSIVMSGPYKFGEISKGQGSRTDIVALRDAVKSGKRGRDLYDDDGLVGAAVKYSGGVQRMVDAYTAPKMRGEFRCILHYGPPGTGKTHCCFDPEGMNLVF